MNRTLEMVANLHCSTAIATFESDGSLIPKMWAHGDEAVVVAQPLTLDGEPSDEERIEMLWLMALTVGARWIGRVDEAWVRDQDDNVQIDPDDLPDLADVDPRVRTALMVQAAEIDSGDIAVSVAVLGIGDDGRAEWARATSSETTGIDHSEIVEALNLAAATGEMDRDDALLALVAYADRHSWGILMMHTDDED